MLQVAGQDEEGAITNFAAALAILEASRSSQLAAEAGEPRLLELAVRAQLEAADMLLRKGDARLALDRLAAVQEALSTCPKAARWLLGELLALCYRQAIAQRHEGRPAVAVELLSTANAAMGHHGHAIRERATAKGRARVLRQLALSHLDCRSEGPALACAQEAMELEGMQSIGRADSLRVLLHVLRSSQRLADGQAVDILPQEVPVRIPIWAEYARLVRAVGLELAAHAAVPMQERLAVSMAFAAAKWMGTEGKALALECLAALSKQLGDNVAEHCQVMVARLRLAAKGAAEAPSDSSAGVPLLEVLAEAELERHAPLQDAALANVRQAAIAAVRRVVRAAVATRELDAAVAWQQCLQPLLSEDPGAAAQGKLRLAVCHLRAGRHSDAKAEAEAALRTCPEQLGAAQLVLLEAARAGDKETAEGALTCLRACSGFASYQRGLLKDLYIGWNHSCWSPARKALAVPRLLHAGAPPGTGSAKAARARLQLAVALRRPAGEVAELADEAFSVVKNLEGGRIEGAHRELREVARLCYVRAQAMREVGLFVDSAGFLGALSRMLEAVGANSAERARCAAHFAEAGLAGLLAAAPQQDAPLGGLEVDSILELLVTARHLLQANGTELSKARPPEGQAAPAGLVVQPLPDEVQTSWLLWVLEMEASCLHSDETVGHFTERLRNTDWKAVPQAAAGGLPPPPLLQLAQRASQLPGALGGLACGVAARDARWSQVAGRAVSIVSGQTLPAVAPSC